MYDPLLGNMNDVLIEFSKKYFGVALGPLVVIDLMERDYDIIFGPSIEARLGGKDFTGLIFNYRMASSEINNTILQNVIIEGKIGPHEYKLFGIINNQSIKMEKNNFDIGDYVIDGYFGIRIFPDKMKFGGQLAFGFKTYDSRFYRGDNFSDNFYMEWQEVLVDIYYKIKSNLKINIKNKFEFNMDIRENTYVYYVTHNFRETADDLFYSFGIEINYKL